MRKVNFSERYINFQLKIFSQKGYMPRWVNTIEIPCYEYFKSENFQNSKAGL